MDGLHEFPPAQNLATALPVPKFPSTASASGPASAAPSNNGASTPPPPPNPLHVSAFPGERNHSFSGGFSNATSGSLPVIHSAGSSPSVSPSRLSIRLPAPSLTLPSPVGASPSCSAAASLSGTAAGASPASSSSPAHGSLLLSPGFPSRRSSHSHSHPTSSALHHDLSATMPHTHGSPLPLLCDPAAMMSNSPGGLAAPSAAAGAAALRHTLSGTGSPSSPPYLPSLTSAAAAAAAAACDAIPALSRASTTLTNRPHSARASSGGASGGGLPPASVSASAGSLFANKPGLSPATSPAVAPCTPPGLAAGGSPSARALRPLGPGTPPGGSPGAGTSMTSGGQGGGGGQSPGPSVRFQLPDASGPLAVLELRQGLQASQQHMAARQLLRPTSARLPPASTLLAAEGLNATAAGGRRLSMTGVHELPGMSATAASAAAGPQRLVLAAAHELRGLQQHGQQQAGSAGQLHRQDSQHAPSPHQQQQQPPEAAVGGARASATGAQLLPAAAAVAAAQGAPGASPEALRRSDPGLPGPANATGAAAAAAAATAHGGAEVQPAGAGRTSLAPMPGAALQAAAAAVSHSAPLPPHVPHPPLLPHAPASPPLHHHRSPRPESLLRRPSASASSAQGAPPSAAAAAASAAPASAAFAAAAQAPPPPAGPLAPMAAAEAAGTLLRAPDAPTGTGDMPGPGDQLGASMSPASSVVQGGGLEPTGMEVTVRTIAAQESAGEAGCSDADSGCPVVSSVRQPVQSEPLRFPAPVAVARRAGNSGALDVASSLDATPRLLLGMQLPPQAPSAPGGGGGDSDGGGSAAAEQELPQPRFQPNVSSSGDGAAGVAGAAAEGGTVEGEGGAVGLFLEGSLSVLGGDMLQRVRSQGGRNVRYGEGEAADLDSTFASTLEGTLGGTLGAALGDTLEGTLGGTQAHDSLAKQLDSAMVATALPEGQQPQQADPTAAAPDHAPPPRRHPGDTSGASGDPSGPGRLVASLGSMPLKALVAGTAASHAVAATETAESSAVVSA